MFTLPKKVRETTEFAAHGTVFVVRKTGDNEFSLISSKSVNCCVGTEFEINSAIAYAEKNGKLPLPWEYAFESQLRR